MSTDRVKTLVCGCEYNRTSRAWKFCEEHGQMELRVQYPLCKCGRDFISEKNLDTHVTRENRKLDPNWNPMAGTEDRPHARVNQGIPRT